MTDIQAEKIEIERVIKRIEAAENRHDADAMLADMVDDPLLHLCGVPPVRGRDAVRQLYDGFFKIFVSTNITSQQIYVCAAGEMAWEQGSYVNNLRGPDGPTQEEGKYLGVYHKVGGKWKGAVFCITPNG